MLSELAKRTEMQIRLHVPSAIRRAYRVFRSLRSVDSTDPIPAELLENCQFCSSREAMLSFFPKNGVVAELGTFRGDFARSIVRLNCPSELHLIDIDYSQFIAAGLEAAEVRRHVGYTHETISNFPDQHFDWIYIDADHSYTGCLRDAHAAAPKIKPGGFLAFNDFAHIDPWLGRYGVHRAAADFARTQRWPLAFFCYHSEALYDVAFRRPD